MKRRQLLLMGVAAGAALSGARAQTPREIEVTAQRFRFTPNVIPLKAGEPVVLLIRSLDFAHGFFVPDLDLRTDLMPGRVIRLAFTPPAPGRLAFLCDNFCGDGHEGMDGHFEVA
ncbi:cupredoxin domain-containing protein [Roseateles sp.]|uniref:cupredoxin domain-containing protein n=1 Tax=Roseateles sp. TaxID=1971397 RepID=UPI0025FAAD08|nr:cupredoxin domain-containing protein [Roseateles sp.]MBV8035015.1 cupredoxin domain-containing protein [Roseateles sp.]